MKRTNFFLLLLAVIITSTMTAAASHDTSQRLVSVIKLEDEVGPTMWMHTKRALDDAAVNGSDLIVLHINTYGGEVVSADSIRTALLRTQIPTVAFIDTNAASAGALITLACDSVWMAPGASYGASSVVNGQGEIMPDKYQSYMRSIMRSTAEAHGKAWNDSLQAWKWRRDPLIAESMVTPEKVTTLSPQEAIDCGYAEGSAHSLTEVIENYVHGPYRIENYTPTTSDSIIGFLASGAVRAVLIMLILAGIYLEMQSPGIGFAGGVAFVAAVLFFVPTVASGNIASWAVVLFLVGLILLALEIFVIPGFGIAGIAGIVAILASLVGGMLGGGFIEGAYAVDIVHAIVITTIGMVLAVALTWYLTSRHGPRFIRKVSELQATLKDSEGYIGVDTRAAKYVGAHGHAVTVLRPAGKVEIDGQEFDAVSLSGFIDVHKRIKAVKFENAQLYVREADN